MIEIYFCRLKSCVEKAYLIDMLCNHSIGLLFKPVLLEIKKKFKIFSDPA